MIQSLEDCTRFTLSAEEGQRLGDLLSHWYAELDALVQALDVYAPNPLVDDTEAQEEWVKIQKKKEGITS